MQSGRATAAEREREERERSQRRAHLGLRLGGLGVIILFGCGLGAFLATAYLLEFLAGMVVGIGLLVAAFFLMPGSVLRLRLDDQTKIS